MQKTSILVIDDDKDVLVATEVLLENEGFDTICVQHPNDSIGLLKSKEIGLILLDMNYVKGNTDGKEGAKWLDYFLNDYPDVVVIPITAYADVELAVNAVKRGAFDFLLKPWDNKKLLSTIYSAQNYYLSLKENTKLKSIQLHLKRDMNLNSQALLGESKSIARVLTEIEKVANTEANVLISGDSGTGKELVANKIHQLSARKGELLFRVDLPSVHRSLFESEMFGYEKGAFTDAKESKPGKFELADKGTLLLDEIGSLDVLQQSKLLSVLQNRKVSRLGSTFEKEIDFRLITTTNKPLKELVQKGLFREDLFFRINTFEIHIPKLSERIEDIPILANYYVEKFAKQYGRPKLKISPREMNVLQKYQFPGNVRELINIIERSVILSDGNSLEFSNVLLANRNISKDTKASLNIADIEAETILKAIDKCNGNMTLAAKELGLTRSSFYRRLEKYGIK